jgi:hypothetical protein
MTTIASLSELKELAAKVAVDLATLPNADQPPGQTGGGSLHRGIPGELRDQFIIVRAALFTRGIFDPVLARFDTASAPQATTREVAEELARVASAIG